MKRSKNVCVALGKQLGNLRNTIGKGIESVWEGFEKGTENVWKCKTNIRITFKKYSVSVWHTLETVQEAMRIPPESIASDRAMQDSPRNAVRYVSE